MTLSSGAESFVVTLGAHHSALCVGGLWVSVRCTFELDASLGWVLNVHWNQRRYKGSK